MPNFWAENIGEKLIFANLRDDFRNSLFRVGWLFGQVGEDVRAGKRVKLQKAHPIRFKAFNQGDLESKNKFSGVLRIIVSYFAHSFSFRKIYFKSLKNETCSQTYDFTFLLLNRVHNLGEANRITSYTQSYISNISKNVCTRNS